MIEPTRGTLDGAGLAAMGRRDLDDLYRNAGPGSIPNGQGRGTALVAPGTILTQYVASFIRVMGWQGKEFDANAGRLVNRVTPFGIRAVRANVYFGSSMLDAGDCIVLDYSQTSRSAKFVRDEIREVSPDLYLGFAYAFGVRWITFALDFSTKAA